MFHICLVANENYIKYSAVLITSIIKSIDTSKKFKDFFSNGGGAFNYLKSFKKLDFNTLKEDEQKEGFVFHLISDKITQNSQDKLHRLSQELSRIYPCEIEIHLCEEPLFEGLPDLTRLVICFRLFIPHFMPNLSRCLYLDIDMLVFRDLRELFTLNLDDKIAAVVKDNVWVVRKAHKKVKAFREFYFNSGFVFINLDEWRKQDTLQKCFEYLTSHKVVFPDQDALNYAIPKEKALVLPFEYNLFSNTYGSVVCKDEKKSFALDYTRKEANFALANPAIVHFVSTYNPWANPLAFVDSKGKALGLYWWDIALQTPFFKDELEQDFNALKKATSTQKDFENAVAYSMLQHSKSFFGYFKMPFTLYKAFTNKNKFLAQNPILKELSPNEYNLARAIFGVAYRAFTHKRKGRLLDFPYRIWRLKLRYEKYGSAKCVSLA